MTRSIFTHESEKGQFKEAGEGPIKPWNLDEKSTKPSKGKQEKGGNEASNPDRVSKLLDIVDNIEDVSKQAMNMQITKNEFFDSLREVTKQKVLGIK